MLCVLSPDGFKNYAASYCEFNSSEMKDIEYILSFYYNKDEYLRYSSSVGEFVGYTELGVKNAERLNRDTAQLAAHSYSTRHAVEVPPSDVTLSSVTPPGGKHTHMLMCSVYGFYPKHISVKWLRDGKVTTSDVTSTEELADGDWYYQIHSHLEFTPSRSGEKVSCMVEHISLSEPVIRDWGNYLSVCLTCLSLWPVFLSFYLFYIFIFDRQYNICHHHKIEDIHIIHCPVLKQKHKTNTNKNKQTKKTTTCASH
uniref:Ig-like domain-containing protein n=1 Tax=Myripristis murdjan TaxID=586833 RepID=A0A668A1P6_9TELE